MLSPVTDGTVNDVGSATVGVPGFIDSHTHLLKAASQVPFAWSGTTVADFHRSAALAATTPMDIADPPAPGPMGEIAARLRAGLAQAAALGLVEITEMGMRDWWYLDALSDLQEAGPLPVRVRIYLASGLAAASSPAQLDLRRGASGGWLRLDGVKFYADGWLGPRTCAMGADFADEIGTGILFLEPAELARRIEPLAAQGWRIATHAIGDRGIEAVLDAYDLVWGGDTGALAAAAPRIEHASLQSASLVSRLAESGAVACLQPSFAVTDVAHVHAALGPHRESHAYPWAALAAAGAPLMAGSDYPIETLDPLAGLARLVNGRSNRGGAATEFAAPERSRLASGLAFKIMSDEGAGHTLLSADPRSVPPDGIDKIQVLGTSPAPF
jgi:predicted amidohydrolase YtcJ